MEKKIKEYDTPKYVYTAIQRVKMGYTKRIELSQMNLEDVPDELFDLPNLEILYLNKNKLKSISEKIGQLKNLRELKLDDNYLQSIPSEIGNLKQLTYLSISGNQLESLPNELGNLESLLELNVSENYLTELSSSLQGLSSLQNLELYRNKFKEIPSVIYKLINLKSFSFIPDIRKNFISPRFYSSNTSDEISKEICNLEKLEVFQVNASEFVYPPPEVISRGIKDIKKFFLQIEAEGEDYLYESKLLIVGEPGAGKTTLSRKLIDVDAPLPHDTETTKGIDIDKFDFIAENGQNFQVNIWDFGGQEIYHSTHQFFLTKRSLYVLVCDTRNEDTNYNYWLQVIELLSDSSPILIIHNEKQDRSREINFGAIRKRFLNVRGQINRSNFLTKRGLQDILDRVKYQIQHLSHVGDKLPKTWIRVRRAIDAIAKDSYYITDDVFYQICEDNGIADIDKAKQLSNYLHDLGVFLHFKDGSILDRTIFLNNTWVTHAVYKVLDDDRIKNELKGRFDISDLKDIWISKEHIKKKDELLELMLKFELCYKVENSKIYILPQLLPIDEPVYEWSIKESLQFRFVYDFMPKGIIAKLIVRLHKYIKNQRLVWGEGVIIEYINSTALIKESYDNKEVSISVIGPLSRIFLSIIVEELDDINSSYSKITVNKLVPCSCESCKNEKKPHFFEHTDLLRRVANDKRDIECPISYEKLLVMKLIENTSESEYEKNRRLKRTDKTPKKEKTKIFISHSNHDDAWVQNYKRHVDHLLDKCDFWDDSMIEPGEEWKKEIEKSLNNARIAILFLSADFLSSKFIKDNELPSILSSAENDGTTVLIVMIKPCAIEEYQEIFKFHIINPDKSLIQMDEAEIEFTWMQLSRAIKRYI